MSKITPFLWFDGKAEEAANYYCSVFKDAKITSVARYTEAGPGPAGSAMTVEFNLLGQDYVALNGGPMYQFSPAISFVIYTDNQAETDHYWDKLSDGGKPSMCGWTDDKFGITWQVTPRRLIQLITDPDRARAGRAMAAMMKQTKIVIAEIEAAADGVPA
jgi:predicted 3-demethylubiquinone-9 3-methyltransferase (glyoxalase superfamily)